MEFIYRTGKKITNKAQLWTKFVLTITIAISSQWGDYFCQLSFRVQNEMK